MVSSSEITIMESPFTDNAFLKVSSSKSVLTLPPNWRLMKNSISYRNSMSSVESCDCAEDCTEDSSLSGFFNTGTGVGTTGA
ncbi:hypothetical protein D3C78_1010740 [compost metagenome]